VFGLYERKGKRDLSEDYIKLTGDKMLEYEVREGDCLGRIGERIHGDGDEWTVIVKAGDALGGSFQIGQSYGFVHYRGDGGVNYNRRA